MTTKTFSRSPSPTIASAWIWVVLSVAVVIRLFALLLAWGTAPYGDPSNYLQLAQNMLAGEGLSLPRLGGTDPVPTSMYPPGLPILLAGIGLIAPLNALTLCIINTLVDCIAALLLARLARLLDAPGAAVPAALAYLLWPSIAFMKSDCLQGRSDRRAAVGHNCRLARAIEPLRDTLGSVKRGVRWRTSAHATWPTDFASNPLCRSRFAV